MPRKGWTAVNLSSQQARRVSAAVEAGFARSRDDFVRHWVEIGLVVTGLLPLDPPTSDPTNNSQEPRP